MHDPDLEEDDEVGLIPSGKTQKDPKDREPLFGFVYMGIVGLLCFNFFLLVLAYLNARINKDFGTWATMMYSLANNVAQLLNIFLGSRFSYSSRFCVTSLGFAIVMLGYPILAMWKVKMTMYIGLCLTLGLGAFSAIFLSTGFGLASSISERAINYYCFGQSLAGVVGWPLIIILECVLRKAGVDTEVYNGASQVDSWTTFYALAIGALISVGFIPYYYFFMGNSKLIKKVTSNSSSASMTASSGRRPVISIIISSLPLGMSAWVIMFVTFLVFPSTIARWQPSYEGYPGGNFFYFSFLVYVFQLSDVLGRYIAILGVGGDKKFVMISSPWRLLLVLFFTWATLEYWIFRKDIVRYVLVVILGVSNGYLLSRTMMLGPGQVGKNEADVAGYTMSFLLVNGILIGSFVSLALAKMIETNPMGVVGDMGEKSVIEARLNTIPGL